MHKTIPENRDSYGLFIGYRTQFCGHALPHALISFFPGTIDRLKLGKLLVG
ncbi:hypothetical protein [Treponema primitia]|uniref:hypothetical protein n=1 Tax=Treponema primitia TaxID=88058 RepID=UPI0002E65546|nr:hypothetical protein [Treponema primitia]